MSGNGYSQCVDLALVSRYRYATPGLHRTVSSLPTVIGEVQITPSVEAVNESRVVSTGSDVSTEVHATVRFWGCYTD